MTKRIKTDEGESLLPDALRRDTAFNRWKEVIGTVPDEYDFIIKTFNEGFPKES